MKVPDFDGAIVFALGRLRSELAPGFAYHNLWHTEEEVMPVAQKLARQSNDIDETDRRLLAVATAFHDLGFTEVKKNHELTGSRIVAQVLPDFNFNSAQIELIIGMIMATRLPQSPRTPLEACIADADLDVLGREDFLARNQSLRDELAYTGLHFTDQAWIEGQIQFLQSHSYFTDAAQALRKKSKQKNISLLQQRLDEIVAQNSNKKIT